MAKLKYLIPVEIRGMLGSLVFKIRHGDPYISRKPRQRHKLVDQNSVYNQYQFKFISEMAREVNKVKFIKDIWMKADPECYGSYQEIYKSNFHNFLYTNLKGTPNLTPKKGFTLKNPKFEITMGKLYLNAEPLGIFHWIMSKFITAVVLIVFRSPGQNDKDMFKFLCLKDINVLSTPYDPVNIVMDLSNYINQIEPNHFIAQTYIFIATLDSKEKPITYSEIISHFIPLPFPDVNEMSIHNETSIT